MTRKQIIFDIAIAVVVIAAVIVVVSVFGNNKGGDDDKFKMVIQAKDELVKEKDLRIQDIKDNHRYTDSLYTTFMNESKKRDSISMLKTVVNTIKYAKVPVTVNAMPNNELTETIESEYGN